MQLTVREWPPIRLPMCSTVGEPSFSLLKRHSCIRESPIGECACPRNSSNALVQAMRCGATCTGELLWHACCMHV